MSTILAIGIIIFSLSSFYFLIKPKAGFNSPFLVSIVTLVSYLVMLEGGFLIGEFETGIYWTRWAFYGLSCPLLMYEISKKLGLDIRQNIANMFLTVLVMITGVLASISTTTNYKLAFFTISSIAFAKTIYSLFQSRSSHLSKIAPYIMLGWSIFPVVFILSSDGFGLIQNSVAAAVYLGLDLFTKVIFYLTYSKSEVVEK